MKNIKKSSKQLLLEERTSSNSSTSVNSPTSILEDDVIWQLRRVNVSFDDSMNAETTISSDCSNTSMDETYPQSCDRKELHIQNKKEDKTKVKANDNDRTKSEKSSNLEDCTSCCKDENLSYLDKMSEYVSYAFKKLDNLNGGRSDSRRRLSSLKHRSHQQRNHKKSEAIASLETSFQTANTDISSDIKDVNVQFESQESCISTEASITNQSITDLSCFDDSIVWSISDMCTPKISAKDLCQNNRKMRYSKDDLPNQYISSILEHKRYASSSRIKNRGCVSNAQAKHLQDLRYGTTFNYSHQMDIIQTTKSFGDDCMEEEFVDKTEPILPMSTIWMETFGVNAPCPNVFPEICNPFVEPTQRKKKVVRKENRMSMITENGCLSPNFTLFEEENMENECFYDSDPGHVRFRHRRPRRAFVKEGPNVRSGFLRTHSMRAKIAHFTPYQDSSRFDINMSDDRLLDIYVEEMKHMKMNIIWHPGQNTENGQKRIMRSRAWIEMGSLLSQTVIHPKFMWKPAYEPNLIRRKINVVAPFSIDLLDIIGILPANNIDRIQHPFARSWCSFKIITVRDRYFLFETEDRAIRDKIVIGLKLIVARLASKVLVAGEVAEDEFFTPGGRNVDDTWWLEDEDSDIEEDDDDL